MPLIKETNYNLLTKQLQSLIEDEQNLYRNSKQYISYIK